MPRVRDEFAQTCTGGTEVIVSSLDLNRSEKASGVVGGTRPLLTSMPSSSVEATAWITALVVLLANV